MVILGEVITIFVVNPVVDREGTRPISPDQGNQADPFDDFALIASNRERVLPPSPLLRTERANFSALRSSTSQPRFWAALREASRILPLQSGSVAC